MLRRSHYQVVPLLPIHLVHQPYKHHREQTTLLSQSAFVYAKVDLY